jgi:hypothetical protein
MVHCCKYNVCLQDLRLRSQHLAEFLSATSYSRLGWTIEFAKVFLPRLKQEQGHALQFAGKSAKNEVQTPTQTGVIRLVDLAPAVRFCRTIS